MSDETPREPPPLPPLGPDGKRDFRDYPIPSIPADDPMFTEGVIFTFPIRPRVEKTDDDENESS